jgi:hypothetical protein
LNAAGEALGAKRLPIFFWFTANDLVPDFSYPAPAIPFDNVGVQQSSLDRPDAAPLTEGVSPFSEMCRECIEVKRQAVAEGDR